MVFFDLIIYKFKYTIEAVLILPRRLPMTKKSKNIVLPDEQIERLSSLAKFDGVAIAMEIKESFDRLLNERPDDEDFRKRVYESVQKGIAVLERLERGQEIIEVLAPILEATKPR